MQARHAIDIAARAPDEGRRLDAAVEVAVASVDLFDAPVAPEFVGGRAGLRTAPAALGWSFMAGTPEGQGPLGAFAEVLPKLSVWKRSAFEALDRDPGSQGAKVTFWDLGAGPRGRIAGVLRPTNPLVPVVPDSHSRYVARAARDPATADAPWAPRRVPLQVLRLGDFAVAALPFEPTVTSGRRVARAVGDALGGAVGRVVVNGYANGYAGYLATPEEYELQGYEGASTLYGQWTLPALCTAFRALATALREGRPAEAPGPFAGVSRGSAPETGAPFHRFRPLEEIMSPTLPPAARLQWFFEEMSRAREASLAHLPLMFTADVAFRDPFRDTRGMDEFRVLFDRLFRQYPEVGFSGFRVTGEGDAFTLTYEMSLRMAVGPTFVTPMASVCRTRHGLVHEMHDYYDFPSGIASPVDALRGLYRSVVRALFL